MTEPHDKFTPVPPGPPGGVRSLSRRQWALLREAYDLLLIRTGWTRDKHSPASQATWSLRKRLLAVIVGGSVVVWAVSLSIMVGVAWGQTNEVFDDGLKAGARLLVDANNGSMPVPGVDRQGPKDYERVPLDYQIVAGGKVIRRTGHAPEHPFVTDFPPGKSHVFQQSFSDGQLWRVYALRNYAPAFEVQIAQPYSARLALLTEFSKNLVVPALVLFVLLALLTWFSVQRLLRPLDDTARAIARKSPTDLTPLNLASRPAELMPMVNALNRVFGQLSHAIEAEKRFTADAAHELRTPLAALRMKTQLLQRQLPDQREALQPLRDDADRCTALIENLLMLARLDHPDSLERRDIDILSTARTLVTSRAAAAGTKNISVRVEREESEGSHFLCNEELLQIALRNLLDNALTYCPDGSQVLIRLARRGDLVTIQVADDGPGVDINARARLSERFFRVLGSGAAGSGLGLSIAAKVSALHGGSIEFSEGIAGKGLAVTMVLSARRG